VYRRACAAGSGTHDRGSAGVPQARRRDRHFRRIPGGHARVTLVDALLLHGNVGHHARADAAGGGWPHARACRPWYDD
jgi:hypothetical protein